MHSRSEGRAVVTTVAAATAVRAAVRAALHSRSEGMIRGEQGGRRDDGGCSKREIELGERKSFKEHCAAAV